ncbi:expressed unknown protein [Seminavis robusta]|uniref:Uncharacterized protein n=1 Tax=Seminavis robusta TaxID=568900 RepID=A0A9N8EYL9_9STRA|nr:expressed unknown protein [Seminavis robusta]|eukprot:Sro2902_g339860.1 n/a (81) ;mRNA; f:10126-10368
MVFAKKLPNNAITAAIVVREYDANSKDSRRFKFSMKARELLLTAKIMLEGRFPSVLTKKTPYYKKVQEQLEASVEPLTRA